MISDSLENSAEDYSEDNYSSFEDSSENQTKDLFAFRL